MVWINVWKMKQAGADPSTDEGIFYAYPWAPRYAQPQELPLQVKTDAAERWPSFADASAESKSSSADVANNAPQDDGREQVPA